MLPILIISDEIQSDPNKSLSQLMRFYVLLVFCVPAWAIASCRYHLHVIFDFVNKSRDFSCWNEFRINQKVQANAITRGSFIKSILVQKRLFLVMN